MLNRRGISRAVVLLTIIAVALIIAIAVPVARSRSQKVKRDMDDLYVRTAEDDAYLRWALENKPFSAIYDSENKRFIDISTKMSKAPPYGTAKEHEGMVIFVKVDEEGNIYTKWVNQEEDTYY